MGRRSVTLVGIMLALVVLADVIFYDAVVGWTAGAFVLAVMLGVCLRQGRVASSRPGWLLAVLLLGLAVMMVVEPGTLAWLLVLAGVPAWVLSERLGWTTSLRRWTRRAGGGLLWIVWQPIHDARTQRRWQRRSGQRGAGALVATVGGWAVPLLLTALFVLMFRAANPIISNWVDEAGSQLALAVRRLDELFAPARLALWMFVALLAWWLLRARPTAQRHHANALPTAPLADHGHLLDWFISVGLVVRCLVLFNALFAVQTVMDVYYLWGGGTLPEGMTYAAYAHRGAYPLVATALLAGAFVLVTFRAGGPAQRSGWARRLVYLWIAQNLFLVISAAWRLGLYVDVYSLTRWRVAAAVWMLLVAAGLVSVVWRVVRHRDNAWLLRVNVVIALAVLYACTMVNIDGHIAWFNVQRCAEVRSGEGVPIDVDYLQHLGIEALPATAWLHQRLADELTTDDHHDRRQTLSDLRLAEHALKDHLQSQLEDVRGWTLRRHRLAAAHR